MLWNRGSGPSRVSVGPKGGCQRCFQGETHLLRAVIPDVRPAVLRLSAGGMGIVGVVPLVRHPELTARAKPLAFLCMDRRGALVERHCCAQPDARTVFACSHASHGSLVQFLLQGTGVELWLRFCCCWRAWFMTFYSTQSAGQAGEAGPPYKGQEGREPCKKTTHMSTKGMCVIPVGMCRLPIEKDRYQAPLSKHPHDHTHLTRQVGPQPLTDWVSECPNSRRTSVVSTWDVVRSTGQWCSTLLLPSHSRLHTPSSLTLHYNEHGAFREYLPLPVRYLPRSPPPPQKKNDSLALWGRPAVVCTVQECEGHSSSETKPSSQTPREETSAYTASHHRH